MSADYKNDKTELLLVLGDAGYNIRNNLYDTILVAGGGGELPVLGPLQVGIGGEFRFEPQVSGDRNAPYFTPGVSYEDYVRGEVMKHFLQEHPRPGELLPNPWRPTPTAGS